jgi:hypothetical protein
MIPAGPYVEDVERRLRSRRAVIEALNVAGYAPETDHEISYFCVPWLPIQSNLDICVPRLMAHRKKDERIASSSPILREAGAADEFAGLSSVTFKPSAATLLGSHDYTFVRHWPGSSREESLPRNGCCSPEAEEKSQNAEHFKPESSSDLLIPFEWFELSVPQYTRLSRAKDNFGLPDRSTQVLVLWLQDDAFRDAPLARLADLISWFRFRQTDATRLEPLPNFAVLGPTIRERCTVWR